MIARRSVLIAFVLGAFGCTTDLGSEALEARGGIPGPPWRVDGVPRPPRRVPLEAGAALDADAGAPKVETCCSDPSLGSLPTQLGGLQWPALPSITSEIVVTTDSELQAALALHSNVRIRVHGAHAGLYTLARSDVELVLEAGAFIEHLLIARSQSRVRIVGGTFNAIEMMPPVDYPNGGTEPEPELMATDITIECVTVLAPDTAFLLRGHRVAILGADVFAGRYAVYVGDAEPLPIDDIIVAHSVLRSAGPEATYRLHGVRRSVVAFTRLSNPFKHNWRVHGDSERNYIGDSILTGTGAMIGWIEGDSIERAYFVRNTVYYDASNGLFLAEPTRVSRLTVTDNVVYSDEPFDPGDGPRWKVARNTTHPYQPPPSEAPICTASSTSPPRAARATGRRAGSDGARRPGRR